MKAFLRFVAALELLGAAGLLLLGVAMMARPMIGLIVLLVAVPLAVVNGFAGIELWRMRNRGRLLSIGLLGFYILVSVGLMLLRGIQVAAVVRVILELIMISVMLSQGAAEACAPPRRVRQAAYRSPMRRSPVQGR